MKVSGKYHGKIKSKMLAGVGISLFKMPPPPFGEEKFP